MQGPLTDPDVLRAIREAIRDKEAEEIGRDILSEEYEGTSDPVGWEDTDIDIDDGLDV